MIAYPFDSATGRPFLDYPATQPEDQLRNLLAEAIGLFIDAHVCHHVDLVLGRDNEPLSKKVAYYSDILAPIVEELAQYSPYPKPED